MRNPHGHGHNYVMEVTRHRSRRSGDRHDRESGGTRRFVEREVMEPFDHVNLNEQVAEFRRQRADDGKSLSGDLPAG